MKMKNLNEQYRLEEEYREMTAWRNSYNNDMSNPIRNWMNDWPYLVPPTNEMAFVHDYSVYGCIEADPDQILRGGNNSGGWTESIAQIGRDATVDFTGRRF